MESPKWVTSRQARRALLALAIMLISLLVGEDCRSRNIFEAEFTLSTSRWPSEFRGIIQYFKNEAMPDFIDLTAFSCTGLDSSIIAIPSDVLSSDIGP